MLYLLQFLHAYCFLFLSLVSQARHILCVLRNMCTWRKRKERKYVKYIMPPFQAWLECNCHATVSIRSCNKVKKAHFVALCNQGTSFITFKSLANNANMSSLHRINISCVKSNYSTSFMLKSTIMVYSSLQALMVLSNNKHWDYMHENHVNLILYHTLWHRK